AGLPQPSRLRTRTHHRCSGSMNITKEASGEPGQAPILSPDGYVVTNTHVVTLDGASGNTSIRVTDVAGRLYDATVVGTDPTADLAVIKLTSATDLTPATFASSADLNVGDLAIAIGAPLGLSGTVTDGIISALNRSITVASSAPANPQDSSPQQTPNWLFDQNGQTQTSRSTIALPVIQTDAAINPGNSGGALLNAQGDLIGINVAIANASKTSSQTGNIGVGFAIPSDLVQRISSEIIATGTASHALLGATVGDATADASATVAGAVIKSVTTQGAATQAGLQAGDVITGLDTIPITSADDLTAQIRAHAPADTVTVHYVRGGQQATTTVTLGTLGG
ncbi:S1C family serine protease, partial [Cnuibacter physcomitrellae]